MLTSELRVTTFLCENMQFSGAHQTEIRWPTTKNFAQFTLSTRLSTVLKWLRSMEHRDISITDRWTTRCCKFCFTMINFTSISKHRNKVNASGNLKNPIANKKSPGLTIPKYRKKHCGVFSFHCSPSTVRSTARKAELQPPKADYQIEDCVRNDKANVYNCSYEIHRVRILTG